jgi:hypothetical protein
MTTLAAAALVAAAAVSSLPAHAAEDELIGIRLMEAPVARKADPRARVYIVDHLKPGTTIKRTVEVNNKTSQRRTLDVYAAAAAVAGDEFDFAEGREANELSAWTTVNHPKVTLDPWETAEVEATVKVPASASKGERYAVLWAQAATAPDALNNVGAVRRVGIRMYLDIGAGGEPASGFDIGEITASRGSDDVPVVDAAVRNTGGRALDVGGTLSLTDGPGSIKAGPFSVSAPTTVAIGASGTVSVRLDPALPLGPWRLELTLSSGTVKRTVTATVTLPEKGVTRVEADGWPITRVSTAGLSVAGAAAVALLLVRRRSRRRVARYEGRHR